MGAILGAEILLPPTRLGHALERVPFLVTFAMKFIVYGTLIVLVVGGRPGGRLVRAVAAMLLSPDLAQAMYVQRAPRGEQATRDLEHQFLVSGDATERLADLGGFALDDLGLQRLHGRAAAMHVYAVAAKPSTNRQKTT